MSTGNNFATDVVEEVSDFGITKSMSREEFETYFHNNKEIKYKNLTLGIMDWGDGRFDVLSPSDNAEGYESINPNPFSKPCDAIDFAVNYLIDYDVNRNPDGTLSKEVKKKSKKKSVKIVEPEYDGPRLVRVFGRDIYLEENPKLSNEQIRQKLVEEYNFPNFQKGKVVFDLDSSTGTLEVLLKFQSKG